MNVLKLIPWCVFKTLSPLVEAVLNTYYYYHLYLVQKGHEEKIVLGELRNLYCPLTRCVSQAILVYLAFKYMYQVVIIRSGLL